MPETYLNPSDLDSQGYTITEVCIQISSETTKSLDGTYQVNIPLTTPEPSYLNPRITVPTIGRTYLLLRSSGNTILSDELSEKLLRLAKPYTLAYDTQSGELFFAHVIPLGRTKKIRVLLIPWGMNLLVHTPARIPARLLKTLAKKMDHKHPFSIHLKEAALLQYIAGEEGLSYLRRNLTVQFALQGGDAYELEMQHALGKFWHRYLGKQQAQNMRHHD